MEISNTGGKLTNLWFGKDSMIQRRDLRGQDWLQENLQPWTWHMKATFDMRNTIKLRTNNDFFTKTKLNKANEKLSGMTQFGKYITISNYTLKKEWKIKPKKDIQCFWCTLFDWNLGDIYQQNFDEKNSSEIQKNGKGKCLFIICRNTNCLQNIPRLWWNKSPK